MGHHHRWRVVLGCPCSWWVLEVGCCQRWWEVVGGVHHLWGGVHHVGLWWAMFIVHRGSVGADSGLLLSFMGAGWWGGAGPCLPLVGWCW